LAHEYVARETHFLDTVEKALVLAELFFSKTEVNRLCNLKVWGERFVEVLKLIIKLFWVVEVEISPNKGDGKIDDYVRFFEWLKGFGLFAFMLSSSGFFMNVLIAIWAEMLPTIKAKYVSSLKLTLFAISLNLMRLAFLVQVRNENTVETIRLITC